MDFAESPEARPTMHASTNTAHRTTRPPLLRSFWIAGFDVTDHLDGLRAGHDADAYRQRVETDYRRVREAGVECVRESIDWRRAARGADFDFAPATLRAQCARRAGMQVVWTLCHAGWPDGLDIASSDFIERFRAFAKAAARALAPYADAQPPVFTPVNEIAFLSYALAHTSLLGPQRADLRHRGRELEQQLVRAALAACDAILETDSRARFVHREAAMNCDAQHAADACAPDMQLRVFDMLAGRLEPRLGGHPRYIDAIDLHWHRTNHGRPGAAVAAPGQGPPLAFASLARLLAEVHARYRCAVLVSETNRMLAERAGWLHEFGDAIGEALEHGVPVSGACLCRVIERPAWEDPRYWRGRRLWDVLLDAGDALPLAPNSAYDQALRDVRARIDPLVDPSQHRQPS
jgi:UDP-galactopyranose mutase